MDSTEKKISFGFSKISKKPILLNKLAEKKVELIDCLEGQNIKIKNAIIEEKQPLIIPLKENHNNLVNRIKKVQEKAKADNVKNQVEDTRLDSELTIDELAAREILKDAKKLLTNTQSADQTLILPFKEGPDGVLLEGDIEPTIEDYKKIPISAFGLAMLRGMGWKEGIGIGKNPSRIATAATPELRPKGLGLGATKIIKEVPKTTCDKNGKELILKAGAFAKIFAGTHKGLYCEVQGLDEESARVIVKTALRGEIITVNECLLLLVTKEDYARNSKVLNSTKYEEYKEAERRQENVESRLNGKRGSNPDNSGNNSAKDKQGKRTSIRNVERHHPRNTNSDSDSSYESQNEKYYKIHKRKDKKRHKDRSRSPPSYRYKTDKKSKSRHRSSSSDSEYDETRRERDKDSVKKEKSKMDKYL